MVFGEFCILGPALTPLDQWDNWLAVCYGLKVINYLREDRSLKKENKSERARERERESENKREREVQAHNFISEHKQS